MKATEILKKYWGFDSFRLSQEEIVQSAINGHDTFALLPTGGGKSICFQIPGIARDGVCIVISPLIALMQDQVQNLKKRGLKAAALTSGMYRKEIDIILDNAKFGGLDFLYVSPERLQTELFKARFKQMKVALIAVDESHCVSEWGHDFRPPYTQIHELREVHPNVPFIAVTATATKRVQKDIIEQLSLKSPNIFEGDFSRPNISYEVYKVENKLQSLLKVCTKFQGVSGIIYCQTRRSTKEIAKFLKGQNFPVGVYNGGMDNKARNKQLELWMNDHIRIMVATNAFGMGIDKPDVRFVLHYEIPNNLEAYFQEAGRSGRDGKNSRNLAFYEEKDIEKMQRQFELQFPPLDFVRTVYQAICNHCRIAIGSGNNESYDFDFKSFIKKYDLAPLETYNALKILQLNDTISYQEGAFKRTSIKFAVDNKTLYNYQLKFEEIDQISTFLSRSYPGIFTEFVEIDEDRIASKLRTSSNAVTTKLKELEKRGVADISWKSDYPQITLRHERKPDDYFRIDQAVYDKRKEVAEEKFDGLLNFLNAKSCRTVELLKYFGQKSEPCGKCDICLMESKSTITVKEMSAGIQEHLKDSPLTFDELKSGLNTHQEEQLKKVLDWLIDEEIISFEDDVYRLR